MRFHGISLEDLNKAFIASSSSSSHRLILYFLAEKMLRWFLSLLHAHMAI